MAFQFEQIESGSAVENTAEYKAVVAERGAAVGGRVYDEESGAALYCLSVNECEDRPPGEYRLFIENREVKVSVYQIGRWEEGVGKIRKYKIFAVEIPSGVSKEYLFGILESALRVEALHYWNVSVVEFEYSKRVGV